MSAQDRDLLGTKSVRELEDIRDEMYAVLAAEGDLRRYEGEFDGRPCVQIVNWANEICPFPSCRIHCPTKLAKKRHLVQGHSEPFTGIEDIATRRRNGVKAKPVTSWYVDKLRGNK